MKTVKCPSCSTVNENATPQSVCQNCGASLAEALLEQTLADIRELTGKMSELKNPPKTFYTFNGFGTALLSYRPLDDGTFEATRWVTAVFVPLIPLATYVVSPKEEQRSYGRESYKFDILAKKGLSAANVLRTYLLAAVALAIPITTFYYGKAIQRAIGPYPAVGLGLLSIVVGGYILFWRVKNENIAYKQKQA
jgi:hypothetical protein